MARNPKPRSICLSLVVSSNDSTRLAAADLRGHYRYDRETRDMDPPREPTPDEWQKIQRRLVNAVQDLQRAISICEKERRA